MTTDPVGIEPTSLGLQPSALTDSATGPITENKGVEPLTLACKASVFPLVRPSYPRSPYGSLCLS